MRLWLDTEFNGHGGQTISVALAADHPFLYFYEVLEMHEMPVAWVEEHVMPVLNKEAISVWELQGKLQLWINRLVNANVKELDIIADHPADIERFTALLQIGDTGAWAQMPEVTFRIVTSLPGTADTSIDPHNALADAQALRDSWIKFKGI